MSTKPPAAPQAGGNYNHHDSARSKLQSVRGAGNGTVVMVSETAAAPGVPPAYEAAGDEHKEPSDVPPPRPQRRSQQSSLDFSYAGPGGLPLPPPGSTYLRPDGAAAPPRNAVLPLPTLTQEDSRVGLPRASTIERVSTLSAVAAETAPGSGSLPTPPQPQPQRTLPPRSTFRRQKKKHRRQESAARRPCAFCFMACCILLCLLVIAISLALLVVYLGYHHHLQPPRMRVTTATLLKNSSSLGRQEANYSLTIQADVYNHNTKLIHVVLRYMPLDLYFNGSLIGTGAVWPVPVPIHDDHEAPGDSVLRSVQLLGIVTQKKDAAAAWQKATTHNDGRVPVELRLVGTFHVQLNIGRWLPSFRFWVYPRCTLWLDPPPPGGALRRSRCVFA